MMLPTDMEIIRDKSFRKWAEIYAKDADKFYKDFSDAFAKLLELGVPFEQQEKWNFKTTF
jgi:cytochrome c peroxidase